MKKLLLSSIVILLTACTSNVYRNVSCAKCGAVAEEINLSADALFKFDKYKLKDLLSEGRVTLDELSEKLISGYTQVQAIELIGHTDRLGNKTYNERLGLNRAKTVRSYLLSHGVDADISVDSKGETEPVTNGCHNLKSPKETRDGRSMSRASDKLRACLQPDRRVVVKVYGIKKVQECKKPNNN
ncbi:MAG: OmpA family protein [Pasteurella sp.]|nr:OmpA family protein [Pasteurella sp.]